MAVGLRQRVVRDAGLLVSRSVFGRVIGYPVSILVARALGPEAFGLLQLVNVIPGLAKYGGLGYGAVAVREISHLRGVGRAEDEPAVRNVSFTADIIWSLMLALAVVGASFFFERAEVRWGIRIAAVSLFIRQLSRLYVVNIRLARRFPLLARVQVIGEIASAAAIVATVYFWGILGVLAAGVASGALMALLFQRSIGLGFRPAFNRRELVRQTRIAVPLALGTLSYGAFGWAERGLVGALFGLSGLGVYMLTVMVIQTGLVVVNSFLQVATVDLYERLGAKEGGGKLGGMVSLPTALFAYVFPLAGALAVFIGPPLVRLMLPAYTDVIPLLPWLAAILWVRAVPSMHLASMNSARLNQQRRLLAFWLVTTGVFVAGTWALSALGVGLQGAMAAKLTAVSVLGVLAFASTRSHLTGSARQLGAQLASYALPLAWGLAAGAAAWQIGTDTWLEATLSLGLFSALYAPLLYWWASRAGLLSLARQLLLRRTAATP